MFTKKAKFKTLPDLEKIRSQFIIPNNAIAIGKISMDQFERNNKYENGIIFAKKLTHQLASFFLFYILIENNQDLEQQPNLKIIAYVAAILVCQILMKKLIVNTINFNPVFNNNERSIIALDIMRENYKLIKTMDDIEYNANMIQSNKIANCQEFCYVLTSELSKIKDFEGMYVTMLALINPENINQNHGLLIVSDKEVSLHEFIGVTIRELDEDFLAIDGWYNFIKNIKQVKNELDENKYPLLNYPILGILFSLKINHPAMVAKPERS